MDSTVEHVIDAVLGLTRWWRRAFWVFGSYVATSGLLVAYVANTGERTGSAGALAVVAVAGVTSAGWMSAVNFMIRSDFRWALLGLGGTWAPGLLLALVAR